MQTLSIVIEVPDGTDILNDSRVQEFVDSIQDVAVRTFVTLRPIPYSGEVANDLPLFVK